MTVDDLKDGIIAAREEGASWSAIAVATGFPPSTVRDAFYRWQRPTRDKPGDEALEALRRLCEPS
jgi:hypothetical protein